MFGSDHLLKRPTTVETLDPHYKGWSENIASIVYRLELMLPNVLFSSSFDKNTHQRIHSQRDQPTAI